MSAANHCLQPDLLILNAEVRTMDPIRPRAEAVAILGERIAAVGSSAELRSLAGPQTRVVNAAGGLLVPGFNDAHVHFLMGGFSLNNINLRPAKSVEEFAKIIAEFARHRPRGSWITGGDWDHESWPGAPLPTRAMIDGITSEHPVLVQRLDGHMALANSAALKSAGITRATADPPGGQIVRDPQTGEPTGLLKDAASDIVARCIPPKSREEKLEAARAATKHAAGLGVTSVTDMSADSDVSIYQELLERGELLTRIYAARSIVSWEVLAATGVRCPFGGDMLRIGCLKGFSDGSLGSSTALFFEPYLGAGNNRGLLFDQMLPEGIMLERALAADKSALQVMIHAIGDEANARVLDIFEELCRANGARDRRCRIEHAQHLRPGDIPRFGKLKVIASMQPYHAADDGRWCEKRIGDARAKTAFAFRSLLDSGAVLAFGSDWTVAPLDPLPALKAAVTRQTLDGSHPGGWIPEEKISLDEALHAFSIGSAYAEFAEHSKGSVKPGKLADLVLFDRNLFEIDPGSIDKARVVLTLLGGKAIYDAGRCLP